MRALPHFLFHIHEKPCQKTKSSQLSSFFFAPFFRTTLFLQDRKEPRAELAFFLLFAYLADFSPFFLVPRESQRKFWQMKLAAHGMHLELLPKKSHHHKPLFTSTRTHSLRSLLSYAFILVSKFSSTKVSILYPQMLSLSSRVTSALSLSLLVAVLAPPWSLLLSVRVTYFFVSPSYSLVPLLLLGEMSRANGVLKPLSKLLSNSFKSLRRRH